MKELIVSLRGKQKEQSVDEVISYYNKYGGTIKTAFGFTEYMPLYGGRVWFEPEIYPKDLYRLYDLGIGLELPLTSSVWDEADYQQTKKSLQKYDRVNNVVTVYSDELVDRIKNDFNHLKIKASVTGIKSKQDIEKKIDLGFDYLVLPTSMNAKYDLLDSLANKEKIILFGSAGCSWNCPLKTCYEHIAKINSKREVSSLMNWCSKSKIKREDLGYVEQDTSLLEERGFSLFKYLRKNDDRKLHKVY